MLPINKQVYWELISLAITFINKRRIKTIYYAHYTKLKTFEIMKELKERWVKKKIKYYFDNKISGIININLYIEIYNLSKLLLYTEHH